MNAIATKKKTKPAVSKAPKTQKALKVKKTKKVEVLTVDERESQYRTLRLMVNNYYDFDRHRLALENRSKPKTSTVNGELVKILLDPADIAALDSQAEAVRVFMTGVTKGVNELLRKMPFYQSVLKEFEGVGPIGAAIILSQFDIKHADTASKMWAFAGLAPVPCLRCKKCQNVVVESEGAYKHESYAKSREHKQDADEAAKPCALTVVQVSDTFESAKTMKPFKGVTKKDGTPGLNYNAWLRSKILGAIGSAQITNGTKWRKIYDDYKHRKQTAGWGVSDAHRHAAAMRYMMKMMLLEIWKLWRAFEGLPVRPSYHEEKQGGHGFNGR